MSRALFVVLLFATLLVAGCSPAGHDIVGTMALTSTSIDHASVTDCKGTGGFADMRNGTTVTVKNEAGTIVGTAALNSGVYGGGSCVFGFVVTAVPDAGFYSIEVGHRGALTYSKADMESRKWSVDLTLGS